MDQGRFGGYITLVKQYIPLSKNRGRIHAKFRTNSVDTVYNAIFEVELDLVRLVCHIKELVWKRSSKKSMAIEAIGEFFIEMACDFSRDSYVIYAPEDANKYKHGDNAVHHEESFGMFLKNYWFFCRKKRIFSKSSFGRLHEN